MKYKKEISLEEREKAAKRNEVIALIMVIVATIVIFVSCKFTYEIYKVFNYMNQSAVYKGVTHVNDANDSLEDVHKLMYEIDNIYNSTYINDKEMVNIDEYICNSLISAYGDKYGGYMNPQETVVNNTEVGSHIHGIGILVVPEYHDNEDEFELYLIDVYDESPAYKAGLRVGDRITHVNNNRLSMTKYNYTESINDVKGEIGTTVDITIIPKGKNDSKVITIERDIADIQTVRYELIDNNVGYIKIREFDSKTDEQFEQAIKYFTSKGINKFVFDMRNNSGGLRDSVTEMLDILIPEGIIITEYNSNGDIVNVSESDSKYVDFESITLINKGTASAAELFTKCLLDYDKTITIGETSYGKGTICTTFPLSNGGAIIVSTGKYLTKSGEDIEKVGIKPDIEMSLTEEKQEIYYKLNVDEDDLIVKAVELLQN